MARINENWKKHKDWVNALAIERSRICGIFDLTWFNVILSLIMHNRWEEAADFLEAAAEAFRSISRTEAENHAASVKKTKAG